MTSLHIGIWNYPHTEKQIYFLQIVYLFGLIFSVKLKKTHTGESILQEILLWKVLTQKSLTQK